MHIHHVPAGVDVRTTREKIMMPLRPEEIGNLLKAFNDASNNVNECLGCTAQAADSAMAPWVEEIKPALFAAATQSFVNFGNLVFAAIPELIGVIQQLPAGAEAKAEADEVDAAMVVQALVGVVREEALGQKAEVERAGQTLIEFAEQVQGLAPDTFALAEMLDVTQEVMACWDQIVAEVDQLSAQLSNPQEVDIAGLRALPANWQRIISIAAQFQGGQDDLSQPGGTVSLKSV